jgi:hypothetical protein
MYTIVDASGKSNSALWDNPHCKMRLVKRVQELWTPENEDQ